MSQLFGGATAQALQATLDDITTERTDGDQGCINVSTSWMRHSGYPVMQPAGGTYSNTLSAAIAAQNRISRSLEASLKQQYEALYDSVSNTTNLDLNVIAGGTVTLMGREISPGMVFKYDTTTQAWAPVEGPAIAKKEPVCECGVKFTGGLHSTWCPCHV